VEIAHGLAMAMVTEDTRSRWKKQFKLRGLWTD
jgi:hypothetical protein